MPASWKVAGSRLTNSITSGDWSAPASTVGATLLTVTVNVSSPVAPSSSFQKGVMSVIWVLIRTVLVMLSSEPVKLLFNKL